MESGEQEVNKRSQSISKLSDCTFSTHHTHCFQ